MYVIICQKKFCLYSCIVNKRSSIWMLWLSWIASKVCSGGCSISVLTSCSGILASSVKATIRSSRARPHHLFLFRRPSPTSYSDSHNLSPASGPSLIIMASLQTQLVRLKWSRDNFIPEDFGKDKCKVLLTSYQVSNCQFSDCVNKPLDDFAQVR